MKLDLLHNGSLKILLTEQELNAFGLTFDDLDYANQSTRAALHCLLDAAQQETGFEGGDNLLVEALPVDGGCLLLVTPSGPKRHVRTKRAAGPYVYEFSTAEAVLALAHSLGRSAPEPPSSSLYQFGDGYRLVVYPGTSATPRLTSLLSEFAYSAGEGDSAAAYTAEHGRVISVGDALSRLCAAL